MKPPAAGLDSAPLDGSLAAYSAIALRRMETMMNDFSKAVLTHHSATESFPGKVCGVLKRCWIAYMDWRLQQLAISRLRRMSDRELKDIGLIRSQIKLAVRGSAEPPILGGRLF